METWKFEKTNGLDESSIRRNHANDCSVRSLALVINKPYDDVWNCLESLGRKTGKGFHLQKYLKKHGEIMGSKFKYHVFFAEAGQPRMRYGKFCSEFSTGRFLIREAGHFSTVIDGVQKDKAKSYDTRCIYACFELVS